MTNFVRRNGVEIAYEVTGNPQGEWLTLIRGLGRSRRFWEPEFIRALGQKYRLVLFDNRGVGESSKVRPPYTTRDMAEDTAAVLDHAQIEKTHVYGVSLGGMIAQHLAIRHPDRIHRLVLGGTTAGGPHAHRPLPGVAALAVSGFLPPAQAARAVYKVLVSRPRPNADEVIARWATLLATEPQDRLAMIGQLLAGGTHNAWDELPKIRAQTLVISPTLDRVLHPSNNKLIAAKIPNAKLFPVALGHEFHTEDPQATFPVMLDFLATGTFPQG